MWYSNLDELLDDLKDDNDTVASIFIFPAGLTLSFSAFIKMISGKSAALLPDWAH